MRAESMTTQYSKTAMFNLSDFGFSQIAKLSNKFSPAPQ